MLQTVTTRRPVVSMFSPCAYCPASTSFRCLNCGTAMCPNCVPGDYCPDCQPAPVAPLMGWSMVNEGHAEDDAAWYAVACGVCGDTFWTEDADDDTCAACAMPAHELAALRMVPASRPVPAACLLCGQPIYRGDADEHGTRHARCGRCLASLDARYATRKEEPIAA
jgi:hypothetical protein